MTRHVPVKALIFNMELGAWSFPTMAPCIKNTPYTSA